MSKILDYSEKIPDSYWQKPAQCGQLVEDNYNGKGLCAYLPFGFDNKTPLNVAYFAMGTNNKATQFFNWPGYFKNFNHVIDNLIQNGEIEPVVIVVIDGNKPNTAWLKYNALGLVQYVEGKVLSYANLDTSIPSLVNSSVHRSCGGWSLGSIDLARLVVNDIGNDFYKLFHWYNIQSGYNATGMDKIDPDLFVSCVCGSADDGGCVTFTSQCMKYFNQNPPLNHDVAQIIRGYTHMISYQLNYFYCAIRYFFGTDK